MEARLAKVELVMSDTREGLDLIESMEKGLEDLREQIQDLRERVLVSQVQPVSHKEFVSFQGKVLSMLASMESRIEALATRMEYQDQEVKQKLAIYKAVVSARVMATHEASKVEVPKPHEFSGKWDAKELDNFLWHMERYFERWRFADMEKGICTIETWEDFKREIKRQFYHEDVAYLARKNMRRLKHTGSIRDYVKEFSSLMLEIPNMTEEELLFNFMDNLQGWAEQELRHRGGDSSKVESLEDSHAMGGGDEVPRDHNAPKKGSGKMPNVREGRDCPKRQEVPPVIEYLVQWKGLPKRQASWEHADALRRLWKHIERKLLETPRAIYTKPLVGRVWKVLEMSRKVHTSLHYGGRHERSPRLSREF
ncbi:hypothetical protein CK203_110371 [Vitis vinifera]|uniref:Retrotransposon gag domain-containing protein n=1 Tax=Vitis vinifera TaxID=29760 RepID=A0A438FEV8_VITVI|nr:hypothetical protein CK203_110371 [Vitis vinifera]